MKKKRKHQPYPIQSSSGIKDESVTKGLFLLFVFLLPLTVCPFIYDYSNLAQAVLLEAGAAAFAVYLVFVLFKRKGISLPGNILLIPLTAFLSWSFLSLSWTDNVFDGIAIFLQWSSAFAILIVSLNLFKEGKSSYILIKAMFFSGSIVASIGILQYLTGLDVLPQEYPPAATFANRNVASEFIVICLPLGVGFFFMEKRLKSLLYVSLGIETMLLFLFYSFTRSCILAVTVVSLISLSVFVIPRIRTGLHTGIGKRHLAALCAIVLVFIPMACLTPKGFDLGKLGKISEVSTDTAEKFKSAASRVGEGKEFESSSKKPDSESVYFRLAAWKNSLMMVKDSPVLGVGLGNLKIHYPRYHRSVVYDGMSGEKKQLLNLHNDYLQVLVELGAIGLLLLSALIFAVVAISWKALRHTGSLSGIMPAALTASLFCYGIVSFFGFPASRAVHPAYVALVVSGLLACSGNIRTLAYKNEHPISSHASVGTKPRHSTQFPISIGIRSRKFFNWILDILLSPNSPSWLPPVLKSISLLLVLALVFCGFRRLEADKYFLLMARAADESKFEDVILFGNKVLACDPTRKIAYSYLGRAYNSLKQPEKGIECLKKVLKYNPWHITAMINLGAAYNELGDYKSASEIFERGLTVAPESAALRNNYGNLLNRVGKNAEALPEFSLAVKYDPDNPVYFYNKGYMELLLGRKDDAVISFKAAARLKPGWELPETQLKSLTVSQGTGSDTGLKQQKSEKP